MLANGNTFGMQTADFADILKKRRRKISEDLCHSIAMDAVVIVDVEDVASSKKRVRKLQHIWTSEQTERLIEAVELRPGTWDFLNKEYRDRNLREALWQEVASELELTRSEVTTKWNSLRCSFRAAFNKMAATKSGQGAKKCSAPNPIMMFLEPTLRRGAPTTSNLVCESTSTDADWECLEPEKVPSAAARNPRKKRQREGDAEYAEVVQCALQTIKAISATDTWTELGNFVASNGREFAAENGPLAKQFKIAINETILKFQRDSASTQ